MLDMVLAFMIDLYHEVIDQEGVGVPVLVGRVRHGFEMSSDYGSSFQISKFIESGGGVGVSVEKFSQTGSVLREIRVFNTLVVFHIHINHMVGIEFKVLAHDFMFKKQISQPTRLISSMLHFVKMRFFSLGEGSPQRSEEHEEEGRLK